MAHPVEKLNTIFYEFISVNQLTPSINPPRSPTMPKQCQYWLIRVGDGVNFYNSVYPFWGLKRGRGGGVKTVVKKIKEGDTLCFFTNKKNGGEIVGIAEYSHLHDRDEERLIQIHTYSNKQQGWEGDGAWDLQMWYKNLYLLKRTKLNIPLCIACPATVMNYNNVKPIGDDIHLFHALPRHCRNLRRYGTPCAHFPCGLCLNII